MGPLHRSKFAVSAGTLTCVDSEGRRKLFQANAIPPRDSSGDLLGGQEASDSVAGLRSTAKPVLDALGIELDFRRVFQRIVGSHDLHRSAIAGLTLVEHHNTIKWLLLLAYPSQTNCQHE